jgi:dienelactone hydrolase
VDNVSEKVLNETSENVAVQGVREGYAVIAPDVRGFGEMANIAAGSSKQNSCHEFQRIAMMFGRTLVGERVHDMGRLIDFAGTVDRIDTSRIAVTGHSGGGTVTLFTAALDDRITVAAPSCYFNMFETSIIPISHCPCNLVPGMMHAGEMYDVAGLFAPRPVLFINGEKDTIYPIEGARQAFEHVKRIYQGMEVPDRCELYVGNEGHRYYNERTWSFMKEWL